MPSTMTLAALSTLALVSLTGCLNVGEDTGDAGSGDAGSGDAGSGDGGDDASADGVTCSAWYRSSVRSGDFDEATGEMSENMDAMLANFDDLSFEATFWDDAYEGRGLVVRVRELGSESELMHTLYQLDEAGPINQFVGGHGFTGLVYVSHPDSGSELQFVCEAF